MRLRLKSILAAIWAAVRRVRYIRHDDWCDLSVVALALLVLGLFLAAMLVVVTAGTGVLP